MRRGDEGQGDDERVDPLQKGKYSAGGEKGSGYDTCTKKQEAPPKKREGKRGQTHRYRFRFTSPRDARQEGERKVRKGRSWVEVPGEKERGSTSIQAPACLGVKWREKEVKGERGERGRQVVEKNDSTVVLGEGPYLKKLKRDA